MSPICRLWIFGSSAYGFHVDAVKEPLITMRPDMGKCVIERLRRGSRTALSAKARHYGKIIRHEDGLEYEGLTRLPVSSKQEGYLKKLGDKDFTDLLGPLHNYLRQSCGRPWDDVYSEIARTMGRCWSWGVRHILSAHLDVAVHTYRGTDGKRLDLRWPRRSQGRRPFL